jgi:pyruvate-formate lyase-activating enzyme
VDHLASALSGKITRGQVGDGIETTMKNRERRKALGRRLILQVLGLFLRLRAALSGRRFYCYCLAGKARDGIFINSDMTVSCNCQDIDGSGQIGDLHSHTLEQILSGAKADAFRRELAAGRFPTSRCSACFHLRTVRANQAERFSQLLDLPRGFSVENVSRCNLNCLACCRGQVATTRHGQDALSLADLEIVGATAKRLGATYCGYYNLGEPFLAKNIRAELEILRAHTPEMEILTSTNGLLLDTDEKREAALLADHVLFSIHGIDDAMVRRYQRGGSFVQAFRNMRNLIAFRNERGLQRPYIYWKYVVFRWNDRPDTIRRAIDLGREAGIDCLQFTFARNPISAISWRYLLTPFFRTLGVAEGWRGRNVWLSPPVPIGAWPRVSGPAIQSGSAAKVA